MTHTLLLNKQKMVDLALGTVVAEINVQLKKQSVNNNTLIADIKTPNCLVDVINYITCNKSMSLKAVRAVALHAYDTIKITNSTVSKYDKIVSIAESVFTNLTILDNLYINTMYDSTVAIYLTGAYKCYLYKMFIQVDQNECVKTISEALPLFLRKGLCAKLAIDTLTGIYDKEIVLKNIVNMVVRGRSSDSTYTLTVEDVRAEIKQL